MAIVRLTIVQRLTGQLTGVELHTCDTEPLAHGATP